jgi:hypothetical protein
MACQSVRNDIDPFVADGLMGFDIASVLLLFIKNAESAVRHAALSESERTEVKKLISSLESQS